MPMLSLPIVLLLSNQEIILYRYMGYWMLLLQTTTIPMAFHLCYPTKFIPFNLNQ